MIEADPEIVEWYFGRLVPDLLDGVAVAAAVASVVWIALPYLQGAGSAPPVRVMATASDDAGLRDYLDAHREIAGVAPVRQASFEVSR